MDNAGASIGVELVALCDNWPLRLKEFGSRPGVTTYLDYEEFLDHDLDAVILANYFHEHAPLAIQAMEAGKHVMSECAACSTLAEAVRLIEAVEASGKIYMFAENCPYMVFNQEMHRLYQAGRVGDFQYGEGEYTHPMPSESLNRLAPGVDHWRNWTPATYYCTHSLAPVMFITDTWPEKVNGFIVPYDRDDPIMAATARRSDTASMIALRMSNGAVVKLLQTFLRGEGHWIRIHGNKGLMENLRIGDENWLRVRREPFDKKPGEPTEQIYKPEFPHRHAQATQSGHGGADFFTNYHFAEAIRSNTQPYLDVYRGVAMSIVGILAYRSALADSDTVAIPDLRKKRVRRTYRDDHWTPNPAQRGRSGPWPSVRGNIKPTEEALAVARRHWRQIRHVGP